MLPNTKPIDLIGNISSLFFRLYQVDPENELLRFAAPVIRGDTCIASEAMEKLVEEYTPVEQTGHTK